MAIYKCKMCSGTLELQGDSSVAVCEFCGITQTVPTADDEKKMNLFNRANNLRLKNEFDKAAAIYENIVGEFPEDAEAYWGLCLCNYGIEYVDDPATGNKIPTCHRASFEKLTEDENYLLAIENADVVAQKIYRDEAREIDRIMEDILSVCRNEEPYDVFICYKETDQNGDRTLDSVIAQDIYDTLTARGMKVFFARISLEDKLGRQYEPYIFSALNSAKVMLVVGTKYEYFHAVWVKNEWSRFLKLMAKDRTKVLVPCFKDIDAYDMPDEFKALQAQNLGKLGAMQDLVRGISKIVQVETAPVAPVAVQEKTVVVESSGTAESFLKRAMIFLGDGDWENVNSYCEKALDLDPENARVYMAKLCAELKVKCFEDLENQLESFAGHDLYLKAVRFADPAFKAEIEGYSNKCTERLRKDREEKLEKAEQYLQEGLIGQAAAWYLRAGEYKKSRELFDVTMAIAGDETGLVCLKSNGCPSYNKKTVQPQLRYGIYKAVTGSGKKLASLDPKGNVLSFTETAKHAEWKNVVKITRNGRYALDVNGKVLSLSETSASNAWEGVVDISSNSGDVFALTEKGKVLTTSKALAQAVSAWDKIAFVAAGEQNVAAIKKNKTVVATDSNVNVADLRDIVYLYWIGGTLIAVSSSGDVFCRGAKHQYADVVSSWKNVVAVYERGKDIIGLLEDGSIICASGHSFGNISLFAKGDFVVPEDDGEEATALTQARCGFALMRLVLRLSEDCTSFEEKGSYSTPEGSRAKTENCDELMFLYKYKQKSERYLLSELRKRGFDIESVTIETYTKDFLTAEDSKRLKEQNAGMMDSMFLKNRSGREHFYILAVKCAGDDSFENSYETSSEGKMAARLKSMPREDAQRVIENANKPMRPVDQKKIDEDLKRMYKEEQKERKKAQRADKNPFSKLFKK